MIRLGKRHQSIATAAISPISLELPRRWLKPAAVLTVVMAVLLGGCVSVGTRSTTVHSGAEGVESEETGWCFVGILIPIIPVPYSWGCESKRE
jgi:uncharacterized protein YceK